MRLPGRLKATTLGDLLGSLHRARMSGTLDLAPDDGRTHRVFIQAGLVVAVELDGASAALGEILRRDRAIDDDILKRSVLRSLSSRRLLGEVLVTDFQISPSVVGAALRRQILTRLQVLEQLTDARIHFRVAVRTPKGALTGEPLAPQEFLEGRRRARDRASRIPAESGHYSISRPVFDHERALALATLELDGEPDELEIKRAYRRLAREFHPDLHPHATEDELRELQERFAEVTRAYRKLVAA